MLEKLEKEFENKFYPITRHPVYKTKMVYSEKSESVWQWITENFVPVEAIVRQGVPQPVQTAGQDINEVLLHILNNADTQIPFSAYGDNEAACFMAKQLNLIKELCEQNIKWE